MTAYEKIREVRKQLGLKQGEIAGILGIHQRDVSKLENGSKKFIPNAYLEFLVEKGYDVNTLFDDKIPLKKLSEEKNSLEEPQEKYISKTDQTLINQVIGYLGLQNKAQLVDYLKQVSENKSQDTRLKRLEILYAKTLLELGEIKELIKYPNKQGD